MTNILGILEIQKLIHVKPFRDDDGDVALTDGDLSEIEDTGTVFYGKQHRVAGADNNDSISVRRQSFCASIQYFQ